ncbi:S-layer homology domain-containing protein, partial [bacterium]|nr:S-layer homology domain-containing protein [candidate division CSSED10-310 bacterium]
VDRFESVLPVQTRPPVIVDIDSANHSDALLKAAASGLIPVGRDHRILPSARVRKLDLAIAFWQIMQFAGTIPDDARIQAIAFPPDIGMQHAAWDAVSHCIATGIIGPEPDGQFQAGKTMDGSDILVSVEALVSLLARSL